MSSAPTDTPPPIWATPNMWPTAMPYVLQLILYCTSLESEEGLRQFQAGRVPEKDQSWYRFVPPQAQEALGKHEVERQSAMFEVFTAEKDYVDDLALVKEVITRHGRSRSVWYPEADHGFDRYS